MQVYTYEDWFGRLLACVSWLGASYVGTADGTAAVVYYQVVSKRRGCMYSRKRSCCSLQSSRPLSFLPLGSFRDTLGLKNGRWEDGPPCVTVITVACASVCFLGRRTCATSRGLALSSIYSQREDKLAVEMLDNVACVCILSGKPGTTLRQKGGFPSGKRGISIVGKPHITLSVLPEKLGSLVAAGERVYSVRSGERVSAFREIDRPPSDGF